MFKSLSEETPTLQVKILLKEPSESHIPLQNLHTQIKNSYIIRPYQELLLLHESRKFSRHLKRIRSARNDHIY